MASSRSGSKKAVSNGNQIEREVKEEVVQIITATATPEDSADSDSVDDCCSIASSCCMTPKGGVYSINHAPPFMERAAPPQIDWPEDSSRDVIEVIERIPDIQKNDKEMVPDFSERVPDFSTTTRSLPDFSRRTVMRSTSLIRSNSLIRNSSVRGRNSMILTPPVGLKTPRIQMHNLRSVLPRKIFS